MTALLYLATPTSCSYNCILGSAGLHRSYIITLIDIFTVYQILNTVTPGVRVTVLPRFDVHGEGDGAAAVPNFSGAYTSVLLLYSSLSGHIQAHIHELQDT